jgi:hypothetical protein
VLIEEINETGFPNLITEPPIILLLVHKVFQNGRLGTFHFRVKRSVSMEGEGEEDDAENTNSLQIIQKR